MAPPTEKDDNERRRTMRLANAYGKTILTLLIGSAILIAGINKFQILSSLALKPSTILQINLKPSQVDVTNWFPIKQTIMKANETLGFERILAINLRSRPDKKATLALMAGHTGLEIEYMDGVIPETLSPSLQEAVESVKTSIGAGEIGCYWSHVNALQEIITRRLSSAIILEDDVDWSTDIKQQVHELQAPMAKLSSLLSLQTGKYPSAENTALHATSWDILWLGSCRDVSWLRKTPQTIVDGTFIPYMAYHDETLNAEAKTSTWVQNVFDSYQIPSDLSRGASEQSIRLVQVSRDPMCLHGYAVSLSGAKKILFHLLSSPWLPVDKVFSNLVKEGMLDSYSVVPPLFSQYRHPNGRKDSDIKESSGLLNKGHLDFRQGISLDLPNSVRHTLASAYEPPK